MSNTNNSEPADEFSFQTREFADAALWSANNRWDPSAGPRPIGSVHAAIVEGDNLTELDPESEPNAYVVVSDDGEWMVDNITNEWHYVA